MSEKTSFTTNSHTFTKEDEGRQIYLSSEFRPRWFFKPIDYLVCRRHYLTAFFMPMRIEITYYKRRLLTHVKHALHWACYKPCSNEGEYKVAEVIDDGNVTITVETK